MSLFIRRLAGQVALCLAPALLSAICTTAGAQALGSSPGDAIARPLPGPAPVPHPWPHPMPPTPLPLPHPVPPPYPQPTPTHPSLPPDAFGYSDTPLPTGARLVDTDTFSRLRRMPSNKILNPGQTSRDNEFQRISRNRRQTAVNRQLDAHPELRQRFSPVFDERLLKPTGDGNFYKPLHDNCRDLERCPKVITMGNDSRFQGIAHAIQSYPTRDNQNAMYENYVKTIERFNRENPRNAVRVIGNTPIAQLPRPEAFQKMNDDERQKVLGVFQDEREAIDLANLISRVPIFINPDAHLTGCAADLGHGHDLDRLVYDRSAAPNDSAVTAQCSKFSADGVMANMNFPMKPYLTCVKNQENRGTCWAFSIASMLEAAYARDHHDAHNKPVYTNLSEQDLTDMVKLVWFPTAKSYGDDAGSDILSKMVSENYRMPYEKAWEYNQSRMRTGDDTSQSYASSCNSYSGVCSDSNHQAELLCMNLGAFRYCMYDSPTVDETAGVTPTAATQVWDSTNLDKSFAMSIFALMFNSPMQLGFDVYPEFDQADSGGWIAPPPAPAQMAKQKSRGGHFVHVVGYVSNETIAATPAMAGHLHDASTGGGYMIVKNSWSTCAGDGGYYYMPISWMKAHAWSLVVLAGIQQ